MVRQLLEKHRQRRCQAASEAAHAKQVLGEYTLVSSTFTLKAANTYGWGLISSNREGTKRYFHFDGLGNTMALTDSSEVVQDTYVWTAFGLLSSSTGSSVNPYRYVGQWGYYDDGAMGSPHGFLLLGVRYYAPEYGRFLTWDPIGVRGYEYCDSNPVCYIDPSGRRRPGQKVIPTRPPGLDYERSSKCKEDLGNCIVGCGALASACVLGVCRNACRPIPPTPQVCVACLALCASLGLACCAYCIYMYYECVRQSHA